MSITPPAVAKTMRTASGARRSSRIAYTAMLGFALLSPMVATAALGQTSTTTVAGATSVPSTVAGDTSSATTLADTNTETTTISSDASVISSDASVSTTIAGATDEPVGGVNAGFGGSIDHGNNRSNPTAPIVIATAGVAGAGLWLMRRRSTRRSDQ